MTQLRVAMLCTAVGLLLSLALLVRETPYTLTAFMFIGQPLLFAGMLLLLISVVAELRHRGGPVAIFPPRASPRRGRR
jgi:hypothetical protein